LSGDVLWSLEQTEGQAGAAEDLDETKKEALLALISDLSGA
jgi:hypothetical protein